MTRFSRKRGKGILCASVQSACRARRMSIDNLIVVFGSVHTQGPTSLAAYSTKLVTTALEWMYEACETDVRAERLKFAAELLVLRHDTLRIIDGVGPDAPVEDRDTETKERANGKEPQREMVQGNEQQ